MGCRKKSASKIGMRSQPEVEPPAARAAADDAVENADQQGSDDQHDDLVENPVAESRRPQVCTERP